jgi:hypothetical protein
MWRCCFVVWGESCRLVDGVPHRLPVLRLSPMGSRNHKMGTRMSIVATKIFSYGRLIRATHSRSRGRDREMEHGHTPPIHARASSTCLPMSDASPPHASSSSLRHVPPWAPLDSGAPASPLLSGRGATERWGDGKVWTCRRRRAERRRHPTVGATPPCCEQSGAEVGLDDSTEKKPGCPQASSLPAGRLPSTCDTVEEQRGLLLTARLLRTVSYTAGGSDSGGIIIASICVAGMELPLEIDVLRWIPSSLCTMQSEECVVPSVGDSLTLSLIMQTQLVFLHKLPSEIHTHMQVTEAFDKERIIH